MAGFATSQFCGLCLLFGFIAVIIGCFLTLETLPHFRIVFAHQLFRGRINTTGMLLSVNNSLALFGIELLNQLGIVYFVHGLILNFWSFGNCFFTCVFGIVFIQISWWILCISILCLQKFLEILVLLYLILRQLRGALNCRIISLSSVFANPVGQNLLNLLKIIHEIRVKSQCEVFVNFNLFE